MIKLFKQLKGKNARLFIGALAIAVAVLVGVPAPVSAGPAVFQQENQGKVSSNNTGGAHPECLIARGQWNRVGQNYCVVNDNNELWHFNDQHNGYYTIELGNGTTGMCLDVFAFNHDLGGMVTTWPCNGLTNQQWYVNWVSNDSFTLKPRHAIQDGPYHIDSSGYWRPWGKCLDVFQFSQNDWADVNQWQCNGAVNQLWTYHPVHIQL